MDATEIIESIKAIEVESPADKIIRQLKQLISTGQLKPGDRLPAERVLADKFGVGRGYIREAIMKLEFFGLLKTSPQSGTYVAGYSIKILDSLLSDVINLNKENFAALIEARYFMEINAVKLAAQRRTEEDLELLELALVEHEKKVLTGQDAYEEDLVFHIRIAAATKNSVIESMMLIIVPDIIKTVLERKVCGNGRSRRAIDEHKHILEAIIKQDVTAAETAMAEHLQEIMEVSKLPDFNSKDYLI
ncbi:FadR/GntR family transcriptional regulator [Chitinophagaceae bacterium LWZ2-11]